MHRDDAVKACTTTGDVHRHDARTQRLGGRRRRIVCGYVHVQRHDFKLIYISQSNKKKKSISNFFKYIAQIQGTVLYIFIHHSDAGGLSICRRRPPLPYVGANTVDYPTKIVSKKHKKMFLIYYYVMIIIRVPDVGVGIS